MKLDKNYGYGIVADNLPYSTQLDGDHHRNLTNVPVNSETIRISVQQNDNNPFHST